MRNIGIWLDKEKAHMVTIENGNEVMDTLFSTVENYHIHGGSGTRLKGGPQDVVQDSKYLEREKHQLKEFFKNIAYRINDADSIVIFGPGDLYKKLNKEFEEHYKNIYKKVALIKKTDSMTKNQLKALIRAHFKTNEK